MLTNLGRWGSPAIRYRTGDQVRAARALLVRAHARENRRRIRRVDDMVVVRGVNVFPSAIESVVRRFPARRVPDRGRGRSAGW